MYVFVHVYNTINRLEREKDKLTENYTHLKDDYANLKGDYNNLKSTFSDLEGLHKQLVTENANRSPQLSRAEKGMTLPF